MAIIIAMPAKAPKDPLIITGLEYLARSSFKTESRLFDPRISTPDQEKRMSLEGEALLKKTDSSFRIALTLDGKVMKSEAFAAYLDKLSMERSSISFIIGGAFGLSSAVIKASNAELSLSPMTLPHRLAFLLLCEQIYRASEIRKGSPYHK